MSKQAGMTVDQDRRMSQLLAGSPKNWGRWGPNDQVGARKLAQGTIRNIKENLFFAFVYNVLGVPVAAGVLYPVLGTLLSPMLAAAAMSLSSVSVIGNALRLRAIKL